MQIANDAVLNWKDSQKINIGLLAVKLEKILKPLKSGLNKYLMNCTVLCALTVKYRVLASV